jgi:ABC-type multidrug transport system ATPase subunit
MGPSGSGKSTLLKALCGMHKPAAGEVLLDGQSLYRHRDAWRSRIGYVPQDDILHLELTVERALGYAARLRLPRTMSEQARQGAVARAIAQVGLGERARVKIAKLSGGQRKRASVALELLARPAVLFLDEPTSGQDPHLEASMMGLFRTLARGGTTVVVTTHAMASLETLDLVAILHAGKLAYYGPPQGLLDFFGVRAYEGVFHRLASASPGEWPNRYATTTLYRELVLGRARGVAV